MITAAPSHDTVVMERLLRELLTRMDGVLDTGTSAVLAGILPDSRAFIDDRVGVLRSLAVVLRALLPGTPTEACASSLDRLLSACEQFRRVLTDLTVPASAGTDRSALMNNLRGAVSDITTATGEIAVAKGIVLPPSADRAAYRERIIKNLESFLISDVGPAPTH